MLDLFDEGFANIFGAIRNWGRWSDMAAIILPDITSDDVRLQNILSIRVLGFVSYFDFKQVFLWWIWTK